MKISSNEKKYVEFEVSCHPVVTVKAKKLR